MRHFLAELRRGFVADRPILIGLVAIWALSVALLASRGINGLSLASYYLNLQLYLAGLLAVSVVALVVALARHRPESPIRFLAAAFVSSGLAARFARGLPMLAALVIFLPIFSKMKSAIPLFNDYGWDDTWIALDQTLHGGTDPWLILQPLVGYPLVTSALSICYHLWLLLLYVGAIYFCFFERDRTLRARFFIAYFACWSLLGVVLACALASVGPCFVGVLLGNPLFDAQMAYLHSANQFYPVWVLDVQKGLATGYLESKDGLGSGISAMPSMHVAIATLIFLATRKISHAAGWFFGIFLIVIMIGSVHLAYHYALDGYASLVAAWLIWVAAGALARRMGSTDGGAKVPAPLPAGPLAPAAQGIEA